MRNNKQTWTVVLESSLFSTDNNYHNEKKKSLKIILYGQLTLEALHWNTQAQILKTDEIKEKNIRW